MRTSSFLAAAARLLRRGAPPLGARGGAVTASCALKRMSKSQQGADMHSLLDNCSSEQAQGMHGSAAHVTNTQCCVGVSEQNTKAPVKRMQQPKRCCIHNGSKCASLFTAKRERKARAGGTSSVSSWPAAALALALSLPLALVEATCSKEIHTIYYCL